MGEKILIVEDQTIVGMTLREMLINLGYEVTGVIQRGENVLDKVEDQIPDLILIDIMLKREMDGVQVAEIIQKEFDIPIIYVTAYADKTTFTRAIQTAPYGYIIKPYNERDIFVNVEIALDRFNRDKKHKEDLEKYIALAENTSDIMFIFNRENVCTYVTGPITEVTKLLPDEVVGEKTDILFHNEDMMMIEKTIADALKKPGRKDHLAHFRLKRGDGTWINMEGRVTGMPYTQGVNGVVINCRKNILHEHKV